MKVWIKPAEGMRIRMPPRRKFLPKEGAWFEKDDFVRRLIADKDVEECDPPKPGAVQEAASASEASLAVEPADGPAAAPAADEQPPAEPEHTQEHAS